MNIDGILPSRIALALSRLDRSKLYELRLRCGGVSVNFGGKFYALSESGLCGKGLTVSRSEIEEVLVRASRHSIYAFNDQIKNGFLSLSSGIRIGICGEVVENKTIKNFSSLNIRFPHEIKGCADKVMKFVAKSRGCFNTLIISPPGCGKTTLLRDLVRQLSDRGNNVLLADERYEIAAFDGDNRLDVGQNTDVLSGADKAFAFTRGIRYMRPDILAADELMSEEDFLSVRRASLGGVSVIASLHAGSCEEGRRTGGDFFERTVVLSDKGGPGCIEAIYDNKSRLI